MIVEDLDYTAYAELLIDTGIGLSEGGKLIIRYHAEGVVLARRCAEIAYRRGASLVEMKLEDNVLLKARIDAQAGRETALKTSPGWIGAWEEAVVGEKWGYLALESFENPGILKDCDQESLKLYRIHATRTVRRFRNAVSAHSIPWCVAAVPGPNWAKDVLGNGADTEQLWDLLQPILLLDRENPSKAWKEKAEILTRRSEKLSSLNLDRLRFLDRETDLEIGLTPAARWVGGGSEESGRFTMPNLPTEEVFTTPDRNRCSGHVKITRPVEVRGTIVRGASLVFEEGLLVDFDAEEGREALKNFVETDPGARHLGEVALVSEDSPIAASGLVFGSILYDENASCHIALGSGYPSCLEGGESLTSDEAKLEAGCNVSLVHVDFMIGSPETTVVGTDRNGQEIVLMKDGLFRI